jgi:hypothetical protein
LGAISSPKDEGTGLSTQQLDEVKRIRESGEGVNFREACRLVRPPKEGLLLIYPISRFSGQEKKDSRTRKPLYDDLGDPRAQDIIGIALSLPKSENATVVYGEYVVGSVGWRPYDQD